MSLPRPPLCQCPLPVLRLPNHSGRVSSCRTNSSNRLLREGNNERKWQLLKLQDYGPIVNCDDIQPPYGNTRRLITNSDVKNDAGRAHTSVVPGGTSPKNADGTYRHEAVWRYLFIHPVEQTGAAVPVDADCQMDQRK